MATLTAQIIVGRAHPNHGGINPLTTFSFPRTTVRPGYPYPKTCSAEGLSISRRPSGFQP